MAEKRRMTEEEKLQYPPQSVYRDAKKGFEYPSHGNLVSVSVHKVYGCCPISVEGDTVFSSIMRLDYLKKRISSDVPNYCVPGEPTICPYALASVNPYMIAMSFGVTAVDLGIAKSGEDGYVMCPAWGPPTCEALVIFKLHAEPLEKSEFDLWYETLAREGHISVPSYFLENFASDETKKKRKKQIEEWVKAGKPKFWEGWRNPLCQPRRKKMET